VGWLKQGLDAADADLTATNAGVAAVNNRIMYGPAGSVPSSLAPGVVYLGY
jgi:hypothetical protein